MKKLALALACLAALPGAAPAQTQDADFAAQLAQAHDQLVAQQKHSRNFFQKIIPASTKLKLKRRLVVETNLGFTVSRFMVSSEFEPGTEAQARENDLAAQGFSVGGSRYIGYALKREDAGSGRSGFAAGKYANKSGGYIYGNALPWGQQTFGGPGIAAFEFLPMDPNSAFIQDNGTAMLPRDPSDPKSELVETKIAATVYDEGVHQALVVEVAYDEL